MAADGRREAHLIDYWNTLVRRRRMIALFAASVVVVVFLGSVLSTRYYASSAVLEIDPKAPVVFDAGAVVSEGAPVATWGPSLKAYYTTQYRLMESRPVMDEAVRRLREEHGLTDFDDEKNPAGYLKSHVRIVPDAETQLVRIVVEYPDPDKAALFANTIAKAYLDTKRERSLEDSRQALEWLGEQLEVYRARKIASDESLHRYRYDNAFVGSDQEGSQATLVALDKLQTDWSDAHARRVRRQADYEGLQAIREEKGLLPLATWLSAESEVLQAMLGKYEELEQEKTSLGARYGEKHPEMARVDAELAGLRKQMKDQVEVISGDWQARLELAEHEEQTLAEELERMRGELRDLGDQLVTFELLKAEAERNEQFYRDLDTRLTEVGISQFLTASNVRQVEKAVPNPVPVRPRILVNLLTSMLLGLLGGSALALVFEYFDFNIKTRDDLPDVLGIPFLGVVPKIGPAQVAALGQPLEETVFVAQMPRSAVAESLRTIRTHALFNLPKGDRARLLITSTMPREGKSFVSANFAAIIAMANTRVLVIDGDMRRPTLHKLFGASNEHGLVDVLKGRKALADVIQTTSVAGLHLLPAGRPEADEAEFLDRDTLAAVLDSIRGFQLVVIDSPPMSAVADAAVFAALVDGLVYVVEAGRTSRTLARHAVERLLALNTHFLGGIVNKVDVESAGYGYDYQYGAYRHYYGDEERRTSQGS
jgi:capsular exopolysaccharide synthesis family protein